MFDWNHPDVKAITEPAHDVMQELGGVFLCFNALAFDPAEPDENLNIYKHLRHEVINRLVALSPTTAAIVVELAFTTLRGFPENPPTSAHLRADIDRALADLPDDWGRDACYLLLSDTREAGEAVQPLLDTYRDQVIDRVSRLSALHHREAYRIALEHVEASRLAKSSRANAGNGAGE